MKQIEADSSPSYRRRESSRLGWIKGTFDEPSFAVQNILRLAPDLQKSRNLSGSAAYFYDYEGPDTEHVLGPFICYYPMLIRGN